MKPIVIATWDFARDAIPAGGAVFTLVFFACKSAGHVFHQIVHDGTASGYAG